MFEFVDAGFCLDFAEESDLFGLLFVEQDSTFH
jgi:hypothetical protein